MCEACEDGHTHACMCWCLCVMSGVLLLPLFFCLRVTVFLVTSLPGFYTNSVLTTIYTTHIQSVRTCSLRQPPLPEGLPVG